MEEALSRELLWIYYSILKSELFPWAVAQELENQRSRYAPD
jgi:hypothetical protein